MVTIKERVVPRKSSIMKEREAGWAYLVPMPGVKYYVFTNGEVPTETEEDKANVAGTPPPRRSKQA